MRRIHRHKRAVIRAVRSVTEIITLSISLMLNLRSGSLITDGVEGTAIPWMDVEACG